MGSAGYLPTLATKSLPTSAGDLPLKLGGDNVSAPWNDRLCVGAPLLCALGLFRGASSIQAAIHGSHEKGIVDAAGICTHADLAAPYVQANVKAKVMSTMEVSRMAESMTSLLTATVLCAGPCFLRFAARFHRTPGWRALPDCPDLKVPSVVGRHRPVKPRLSGSSCTENLTTQQENVTPSQRPVPGALQEPDDAIGVRGCGIQPCEEGCEGRRLRPVAL